MTGVNIESILFLRPTHIAIGNAINNARKIPVVRLRKLCITLKIKTGSFKQTINAPNIADGGGTEEAETALILIRSSQVAKKPISGMMNKNLVILSGSLTVPLKLF
jgi:hypothetical protein